MPDWVIYPFNVPQILIGIVLLVLAIYLVRIPGKSFATRVLIVFVITQFLQAELNSLRIISANSGWAHPWVQAGIFLVVTDVISFATGMSLLVFSYRLGDVRFRREEWWAYAVYGIGTGIILVVSWIDRAAALTPQQGAFFVLIGWVVLVTARKWRRAAKEGAGHDASVYSALTLFFLFPLVVIGGLKLMVAVGVPTEILQPIDELFMGLFFGLFGLVFLQYGPDPSSLEAKVVIGSLMGVVILVTLFTGPMNTFFEIRAQHAPPEPEKAIAFVPNGGGYVAEGRPVEWPPAPGDTLRLGDDSFTAVKPPFDLVIYGRTYDSLYVGANGLVTFERPPDTSFVAHMLYDFPAPVVAVLNMDLNPEQGGAVTWSADSSGLTVAWRGVPEHENENTTDPARRAMNAAFEMTRGGEIVITHGPEAFKPILAWRYGISPGQDANAARGLTREVPNVSESTGPLEVMQLPVRAAAGEALWRERRELKPMQVWSRQMSFLLLRSGLITMLLILIVIPVYFRASVRNRLYRLLGAMRTLDEGDLSVRIPVRIQDEVGQISGAFNGMAQALQTYNEDMERLVDERTAELRATQAQLVEQEKLASLGALTAGIAHEIKNPLNFVNNFAEVNVELADELAEALAKGDAEEATALLADLRENATQIAKHGKRADSIVRAMMQHARGGASMKETIVVNTFLEEYATLAWHGMRARDDGFKAELVRDFAPDAGSLEVLPQELGRVVLNLLNNAFDAVRATPDARVMIGSKRTDAAVEITVSDNGPGISPEIRDRIFEPFFTTKPTGEGTGLGLSLSYDIVTKGHGGSMRVEDDPSGGAMFRITIPA